MTSISAVRCVFAAITLLFVTGSPAQTTAPQLQSPYNYRKLLEVVVNQHPTVLTGLSQIESARQDVEGARWQFLPTPTIGVEKSSKTPDNLNDRRTAYARLQQPLWTGGRLTAQLERAQAQETIAHLTMEEQRLTLGIRWLQLWAEVQATDLKVLAFADSEELHRKYVKQVQSRAKEGHAPRSDVQLSLTRLAAVQAELEQARAQKQQAVNRLEQMHGAPLPVSAIRWTAPLQTNLSPSTDAQRVAKEWLNEVQEKHPTLQKAAAVELMVKADVDLSKSRNKPELYVRAEILNGDVTNTRQQIFVGLASNFGAGLSTLSSIAAAQAKFDAQKHETETRRREIAEQVLGDVENLESQTQRVRYLELASNSADEFLQASERQYAAGRKSWQELMNAAREKAQTLAQLADAKTLQWLAQQRLYLLSMGIEIYLNNTANP